MNAKELAKQLDGIEYPVDVRIHVGTSNLATQNGLVICYGESDDLLEFYGAINDEIGCYDGCVALVDRKGLLPNRESIDDDAVLEDFFARRKTASQIKVTWNPGNGVSWGIETDIPHEAFDIMEDGEIFCRGIVFALSDIPE